MRRYDSESAGHTELVIQRLHWNRQIIAGPGTVALQEVSTLNDKEIGKKTSFASRHETRGIRQTAEQQP